ncbi:MAG: hypothetical protein EOP56_09990 [Sphingobacteriales bacterium]|nr:MAG: hypothetical protein EOP56_09990 [Sphingobacteriales bacterium]
MRKPLLITVAAILIAATAATAWFSYSYDDNLKLSIAKWVTEATDSTYRVEIGDAQLNIVNREITATNIRLIPDVQRMQAMQKQGMGEDIYYELTIPSLTATGVNWAGYISRKQLSCKKLMLDKAQLTITRPHDFQLYVDTAKTAKVEEQPLLKKLHADELSITNVNVINRYISATDTSYLYLDNGNVVLTDWTYEPREKRDPESFAFAENGKIAFGSIRQTAGKSLYKINCRDISFSTQDKTVTLKNLMIEPTMSNDSFYSYVGKRTEIFRVRVPELTLGGISWQKLVNDGELRVHNTFIKNAAMDVHFSMLLPSSGVNKGGQFPQQLLQNAGMPIELKNVMVENSVVTYTEVSKLTNKPGSIAFSEINGIIRNVTNIPEQLKANKWAVADLKGKFNKESDLKANFVFYLGDSTGKFQVDGYAKNIRAAQVNEVAQALALAEIKSLDIDSVDIKIRGNENSSTGDFTILYNDLKVGLQKINKETGKAETKAVSSFVANHALLHRENPEPGKPVRTASSIVNRSPKAGFFNIIWKNIFQGAANTAARNEEVVKLMD